MTILEAKNKAANEVGYGDYAQAVADCWAGNGNMLILDDIINRAMEIHKYACISEGFTAAREMQSKAGRNKLFPKYIDAEHYVTGIPKIKAEKVEPESKCKVFCPDYMSTSQEICANCGKGKYFH